MNTQDLSKFGYRELNMASDLLKAYANGNWKGEKGLSGGINVEFNFF